MTLKCSKVNSTGLRITAQRSCPNCLQISLWSSLSSQLLNEASIKGLPSHSVHSPSAKVAMRLLVLSFQTTFKLVVPFVCYLSSISIGDTIINPVVKFVRRKRHHPPKRNMEDSWPNLWPAVFLTLCWLMILVYWWRPPWLVLRKPTHLAQPKYRAS